MGTFYRQNRAFIVELAENEWYGKDTENIINEYTDMARNRNCDMVAIFVTPDPLFPACGHEKRHRVHSVNIVGSKQKPFMLEVTLKAVVTGVFLTRLANTNV